MKILFVAALDGWMGIHIRHFAAGFAYLGHDVKLLDYKRMERGLNPFARIDRVKHARRHQALEKEIKTRPPDLIIFVIAHLKFDFARIRSFFSGTVVVYDLDGPGWKGYEALDWIRDINLLVTVSQVSRRFLNEKGIRTEYLPHGVDAAYYRPLPLSGREKAFYGSPLAFVGRPTARRIRLFGQIADQGLVLWGRRWSRRNECPNAVLRALTRSSRDIIGNDVVKIYSGSDLMLNVLREPLHEPPTIMSLQAFLVPAVGTCLLTEWVEELEAAFEPGCELLAFKSEAEFRELAVRYSTDKKRLREIGANGRARCLADHTHEKRAAQLVSWLQ